MARTSPAPNVPPIPGMCPGVAVAAGGGGGGGGSGKGSKKGKGKKGAGKKKGKNGAKGGGKKAKGSQKSKSCGKGGCGNPHSSKGKGDPVDVMTGAVGTLPIAIVDLPGPLPLFITRQYSSLLADTDIGLGFGWTHSLAWTIEVRSRHILVRDPDGEEHHFPAPSRLDETVDGPNGWRIHRTAWGYVLDQDDELWHVFSAQDPETDRWLLTAVEDLAKNRVLLTYEDGHLAEVVDSVGRRVHFNSNRTGRVHTIVIAPGGAAPARTAAEFLYSGAGDLSQSIDAVGSRWHYEYHEHLLVRQVNRVGATFYYRYDDHRRCIETWGDLAGQPDPSLSPDAPKVLADGRTPTKGFRHVRFDYVHPGYSEVVDGSGVERFDGAPEGALGQSAVGSCVTDVSYSEDGHVTGFTDGAGGHTAFERDERGRLISATDAAGRKTTFLYDASGRVVEVVDPKGGRSVDTWDYHGHLECHRDQAGGLTTYRYDARGMLIEEVDPVGARTLQAYDAYGNLTEIRTATGALIRREYDEFGNCTAEIDGRGSRISLTYDQLDRCTSRSHADGSHVQFDYDGEGRLIREQQRGAAPITMTYGMHDDVHTICDELGNRVVFEYGLEGQLLGILDEQGRAYRCTWDACGNLQWERFFDGREIHYAYDAANRLSSATLERGELVTFEYDSAGQLLQRNLPDGTAEEYAYDALGDIVSIKTPGVSLTFVRDPIGRVVEEHQTVDGETVSVWTRYDLAGEEVERRSSLGHAMTLTRDAGGYVTERLFGEHRLTTRYDENGRQTLLSVDTLGHIESTWSESGYLAGRRTSRPDGSVLAERLTSYSLAGSLQYVRDSRAGDTQLAHDALGRLTGVRSSEHHHEYVYDASSNVRRKGEHRAYSSGDRLDELEDTRYEWSESGCLVARSRSTSAGESMTRFSWAPDGRLASVLTETGSEVRYTYDSFGRRHAKHARYADGSEDRVRFIWDGDVLLHEQTVAISRDGARTDRLRTYVFDDDLVTPLAHETTVDAGVSTLSLYETDALGTPVRIIEHNRVEDVAIDECGYSSSAVTNIRFPGQYYDAETGLTYNRFRYYDPETCRFISVDPSGLDGGLNPFVAPWDPFSLSDPDGLRFSDATKKKAMEKARGPDGKVHCQAKGCGKVVVKGKKSVSKTLPNGKPNPAYKKPPPNEMQFDHKKPRAKGGSDSVRNCQVMCRKCNRSKSDKY